MLHRLYTFVIIVVALLVKINNVISIKKGDIKLTKSCPKEGTMVIKGYNVFLSDFVRKNGDIYNLCSYKVGLKIVQVFALNNLFIDVDVDVSGSHFKLFFLAPKWVVLGERRIAVDGTMGTFMPRANNGNTENTTGADGKPGLTGGPGGNFFGIGENFVDGHRLVITANGGVGGTGQYGGNGYVPPIGRYVDVRKVGDISCGSYYSICRGNEEKYQLILLDNQGKNSSFICKGLYEKNNMTQCSFIIFGREGDEGGRGGNGGIGGMGGLPGRVKLVALSDYSHISTSSIAGSRGMSGGGGTGGKSGENGYDTIYTKLSNTSPPKIGRNPGQKTFYRLNANGSEGYNSVGYKEVLIAPDALEQSEIDNFLASHKAWLREVSGKFILDKSIITFYRNLYDKNNLTSTYNISRLINEVQDINDQFRAMKTDADFVPFYESMLGKVYGFAETLKSNASRDQERSVLALMYVNLMGRIYNFQKQSDNYIDIRVPMFLESEQKSLRDIIQMVNQNKSLKVVIDKLSRLNLKSYKYENPIEKLTNQSKLYIEKTISIEIKDSSNVATKKMGTLMNTILKAMRKDPSVYKLLKWGKELQDLLIAKSYLTSIKLIKDVLSSFLEFAEVVSAVVEIQAKVPKLLSVVPDETKPPEVLPQLLKNLNSSISRFKTDEVARVSLLIVNVLNRTVRAPKLLMDVTEELRVIQLRLNSSSRLYVVNALRSDLLAVLKIKLDELSYDVSIPNNPNLGRSQWAFTHLNRAVTLARVSRAFVDIYNEYAFEDDNHKPIVECFATPNDFLKITISSENSIYSLVYPVLQHMEDIITETSGNPEELAKLVFTFMKEEVLFGLHRIKYNIMQLAERFSSKYNTRRNKFTNGIIEILEKLGAVCTALISVLDRLQQYLHLRQMENLMADGSAVVNKGTVFTDVVLSKDFEFLKKHLSSSLVLMHYKTAVNTFKNFVFPLAKSYFESVILPEHFNTYDSFENTTAIVLTQLDEMLDKVEDYKILVLTGDRVVSKKFFGSRNVHPSDPFYVWNNNDYKDAIFKLLSGQRVLFNADITKSKLRQNAIKLNSVEVYLKAKDDKIQKNLDEILNTFMIMANHSGNCQYRLGNDMYLTTSNSLELSYFYERNKFGNPILVGGAYEYIRNAEVMLSPYTLWEIQLIPMGDVMGGKEYTYKDLVGFKDEVDLELGGYGYYIQQETLATLDLNVSKFYKSVGTF